MYLPQRHTALLWGIVNPNLTALIYYMVLIEIRAIFGIAANWSFARYMCY